MDNDDEFSVKENVFHALGEYLIENREMLVDLLLTPEDDDDMVEAQGVIDDLGHELIRRFMALGAEEAT